MVKYLQSNYNELGYNEHLVITKPGYNEQKLVTAKTSDKKYKNDL